MTKCIRTAEFKSEEKYLKLLINIKEKEITKEINDEICSVVKRYIKNKNKINVYDYQDSENNKCIVIECNEEVDRREYSKLLGSIVSDLNLTICK